MELRKFISKQAMGIAMGCALVFLLGMVIFARLPYVSFTGERIVWTPLEIDMNNLNFAGEKVDIDPLNNPLGHEKLEKELNKKPKSNPNFDSNMPTVNKDLKKQQTDLKNFFLNERQKGLDKVTDKELDELMHSISRSRPS